VFNRLQRFYNSIKLATDVVMLVLAFLAAYVTRFHGPFVPEDMPPLEDHAAALALALLLLPASFHQARLYTTNRVRTHIGEVFEVFKAVLTGSAMLVVFIYFARERYSRLTLALFSLYAFLGVAGMRLLMREALHQVRLRGYNLKSILVVGAGELGERVVQTVEGHRELGFRVVGVLTRDPAQLGREVAGAPVVAMVEDVERVLDARPVDQVILALPTEDHGLIKALMERLSFRTVDVKVVPDLYQYITLYGGLEEFGGLPIVSLQGGPLHGWSVVSKRAFDIVFSLLALLLSAPVMLLVALAVRLTSRGPVLYRQERMGMDGRTFHILKFRTMRTDAEAAGAAMASAADPRRTPVGTFLRKTSLDELPQFFNVLVGDMSLVGPRPERPVFIEEFKRQIPRYHLRHKVKAGITGWAQINGLRGQTSIQKRIEYDLYYIENWSLALDFKILVKTALGGFLSKNAY
jgi:Undecaprenyl-phosphate glucose phosphotransferase